MAMTRKIGWLALPLVLGASMLGVKWRAEHPIMWAEQPVKSPAATAEDLWIRSLLLKPASAEVFLHFISRRTSAKRRISLSKDEVNLLIHNFYVSPDKSDEPWATNNKKGVIAFAFSALDLKPVDAANLDVYINPDNGASQIFISRRSLPTVKQVSSRHRVHPYTVKYWISFLITNPRMNSELRARLNQ